MVPLPIDEHLPALVQALRAHNSVVLHAPTGAGKTTRVPPALFDAGFAGEQQIVLLQPRRLAARAAAARISQERGTSLGELVGYEVRFDRRSSRKTRMLAVTDGVFVRMLQDDPLLERIGVVLFDEFHERNLNSDLALAMVRKVQCEVRPDLKLVVMSATLDVEPLAQYLDHCPVIASRGRIFPIDIQYESHSSNEPIHIQAARAVEQVFSQSDGDVLVFLPGVGEIRRTVRELETLAQQHDSLVLELYGDLPLERQQAVLAPADRRKVVLATNVAETSVTVEGVTAVVDCGWARVLRIDPQLGINRLKLERISQASAEQRSGRAGRTAPGVCRRLWTAAQHRHFPAHTEPEIRRIDLSGPVLELLAWGEREPLAMPWYEHPPSAAIEQSLTLLQMLGAVDPQGVTPLGRMMARLPVHPRIARLILEGARCGHRQEAALVGAMLSEREVFRPSDRRSGSIRSFRRQPRHGSDSDLLDRLFALDEFERTGTVDFEIGQINSGAAKFVLRARDQLLHTLSDMGIDTAVESSLSVDEAVRRGLAAAYLDRLARRREPKSRRALMAGGRGVQLADTSAVTDSELFVCIDLDDSGAADAKVRLASAVERAWLPEQLARSEVKIEFDVDKERVVAVRQTRIGDLIIGEVETGIPSDIDPGAMLAREATVRCDVRRLMDDDAMQFIARVKFVAQWMPELNWPQWDENVVFELLPELCRGRTSLAELRAAPVLRMLQARLTSPQLATIEREAPARLTVPSGSKIALQYEPGQPPVLAVRIQEIFGWTQTPRIALGRVPVLLHLLAPSNRPQQITADLASFWKTTYPQMRNELRRRYPRHSWPDDPLTAPPQRRPPPRR